MTEVYKCVCMYGMYVSITTHNILVHFWCYLVINCLTYLVTHLIICIAVGDYTVNNIYNLRTAHILRSRNCTVKRQFGLCIIHTWVTLTKQIQMSLIWCCVLCFGVVYDRWHQVVWEPKDGLRTGAIVSIAPGAVAFFIIISLIYITNA